LSALDAARAVKESDQSGCLTMANAARRMLARGEAIAGDPTAVTGLEEWEYEPLYESTWRAEELVDQTAYNKSGEEVGEVHDILMKSDGTLSGIIIEGGGILDIGDTHERVAWKDVRFREGDNDAGGVTVPLDEENLSGVSLFWEDPEVDSKSVQDEVRASAILNQRVRFETGAPYGYVDDLLISDGRVQAILIRPDIVYGPYRPHPYAVPYHAYDRGYNPGYDVYLLPYTKSQLTALEGFDIEKVKGPSSESEPDKSS